MFLFLQVSDLKLLLLSSQWNRVQDEVNRESGLFLWRVLEHCSFISEKRIITLQPESLINDLSVKEIVQTIINYNST